MAGSQRFETSGGTRAVNRMAVAAVIFAANGICLFADAGDTPAALSVVREKAALVVSIAVDPEIHEVELRFYSSRNDAISKDSDVSAHDPRRGEMGPRTGELEGDTWYPVVDLALEPGIIGTALFDGGPETQCWVNGPYWRNPIPFTDQLNIPAGRLEYWENALRIAGDARTLRGFHLRKRLPLIAGRLQRRFALLSEQWSGKVALYAIQDGESRKIDETAVEAAESVSGLPASDLGRDTLLRALRGSVAFTARCQNKNPQSLGYGGLFLFYDLDAATYRTSYWMWGWGPSVRLLLAASEHEAFHLDSAQLRRCAQEIGASTRRFLYHAPGTPLDQIVISRWGRGKQYPDGFRGAVTFADSLFLSGWAWIPLYETTGDEAYLELSRRLILSADQLMDRFKVLPHSYWIDTGEWSDFTLDECGFGMEGFAETYRVTGGKVYQDAGRRYLEQHLDLLEQPDGLWGRSYKRLSDETTPTTYHTRGQGWAMEGLLAAHRLLPDEGHLQRCRKMADHLVDAQLDTGCWPWRFDRPAEEVGISEKGTALWSYLFYRLYHHTREDRYLAAARKALRWCLKNQYRGADVEARGSIPGRTKQSAVGYRQWFDVSCVYTSAFFGLALLEELGMNGAGELQGALGP